MVAVIVLAIVAIWCLWRILDSTQPFPTPNADRTADPSPSSGRARTAAPALRVHLCTRGCGRPVARPGEPCYPYCESVAHSADRVLRGEAS